jgi:hypothetical protein
LLPLLDVASSSKAPASRTHSKRFATVETALDSQQPATVDQRLPDGSAILDGDPIVWTDVLEPFGTDDAPGKPLAVFGALSFRWMGEHGTPRIDTSEHVWFANAQPAVRCTCAPIVRKRPQLY